MTVAIEYAVVCNKILVEFCERLDIPPDEADKWRVAYPEYPPNVAHINDMFWSIEDMVTALIYKIPCDDCCDRHWEQLEEGVKFKTLLNYYKENGKLESNLNNHMN